MTPTELAEEGALVALLPERGTLTVRGKDRRSWLNGLLTCDLNQVELGKAAFGLALTKQGKISSDLFVLENEHSIELSVAAGVAPALRETLDRHLVMEDAEIEDRSAELGWIALYGPSAAALARQLGTERALPSAALALTALGGALVVAPRADLAACGARLVELGGNRAHLASAEEWLGFRVAQGLGAFGIDFGPLDNPHEAALERRAISWTKGCYLGQEVVCMQDMRGKVKRRLSLLQIDGAAAPGSPVSPSGGDVEPAGEITSSVAVEAGRSLALAKLKAPFFEPGSELLVVGNGARVLAPPEVDSETR